MTFTICGGRITIGCPCGYHATGHQPVPVMDAIKDHESFTHGKGLSPETHAALRALYAEHSA